MSQVSLRDHPWVGCGTLVDNPLTTAEAIKLGGLDWDVEKVALLEPLEFDDDGSCVKYNTLTDRFVTRRVHDKRRLGYVGANYVPFQNIEAFEFADSLRASDEAAIVAVGTMRFDRVVYCVMKLNELDFTIGGEDKHETYLLLRTSHDGSRAVGLYVLPFRIVCTNQMTIATGRAKYQWSVNHVRTLKERLREAQQALNLTGTYIDSYRQTAERLLAIDIELDQFHNILRKVIPERPKTDDVVRDIMTLYQHSPVNGYTGTAWGALNAVTEFYDHGRPRTRAASRWATNLDGAGVRTRNRVAALLLARG